jgi:CheY-like chemotaxis protein
MASTALATDAHDRATEPSALRPFANAPAVLVVDCDPETLLRCTAMLDELGYPHFSVSSARQALELLAITPAIQIMLANVHMPSIDGIALIEEVRARICDVRPIAMVMLANQVTAELAVKGMHLEVVDLLTKPFGLEPYSAALRRAVRYLASRRSSSDRAETTDFGHHLTRLLAVLEGNHGGPRGEGRASDKDIAATLRCLIHSRSLRTRFFPSDLFADPAWDILLDLTRAHFDKQDVSVSSVCIAASVPMSTALRWVRQMTDAGLLQRWTDPRDRRRDLIALTDKTRVHMMEYLTLVYGMLKKV